MSNSNDIPVTRAEERELYGEAVTIWDEQVTFERQIKAIDENDVCEIASEFSKEICKAFHESNPALLGGIISSQLCALAQARANFELYGTSKQRDPILRGTLADLGKLTIKVQA